MTAFDRGVMMAMTVVLIIGGYQFYFWAQRQRFRPARQLETRWDSYIAYDPRWVWIYSGLYYPMMILVAFSFPTWHDFGRGVGAFLLLLAAQVFIFLLWPVEIPAQWRTLYRAAWEGTYSQRFLDLVWSYDKLRNSMPSMHVSVATMIDLTIWKQSPSLGAVCGLFPFLIAVSALKTKQHYVVDVVPGAIMGASVFGLWSVMT